jgi:hypothetical protein
LKEPGHCLLIVGSARSPAVVGEVDRAAVTASQSIHWTQIWRQPIRFALFHVVFPASTYRVEVWQTIARHCPYRDRLDATPTTSPVCGLSG